MRARSAVKALLATLLVCLATIVLADVAVPQLTGRVVDQTGTLSSSDVARLTQKLKDLETRKGSQVAVLIVPTTQPETIEQFSIRVAEAWKIGRRKVDDGALLVIAKSDRKLRIEVGYGLEGSLTDATARRIIDEVIAPKFRSGDFAGGIDAGVDRMIGVINGEALPVPQPQASHGTDLDIDSITSFAPVALFGALVIGGILRTLLGRLLGSLATGGAMGVIAWVLVGSAGLVALSAIAGFVIAFIADSFASMAGPGSGRRGGWSSGSSSGGWSSGSSSSGGFSGGGGSFGGGGASGSW
ncbi:TPM domain-containing protein [Bradyrhizobium aeschynomenes]|uniref:TPM domain-containing protein n=1 Tax=Bradyrhizobium aeschynomenes TaxID=2734909 RepID=UPI001555C720|nr:YgcG family protein [Bradyrhizobium aeschynomenes]NPV24577.1 YgcG family protein [Bradyrhizobium aeschynomenes]